MFRRTTIAALAALLLAAPAGAAPKHQQRGTSAELRDRQARVVRRVERAKTMIRWFERHHHGKTIAWLRRHPRALRDVNVARQRVIRGRAELERIRALLRKRETPARPRHYREWLCIYSHENGGYGWTAHTGNGYYGGLQMDREFQQTYGASLYASKGTADRWTSLEQMWVAERAWRTRGFYPWPTTARMCGLI